MTDCWMWDPKEKHCGGYNYESCPPQCKHKRTKAEQFDKEVEVLAHLDKDKPFLHHDFVSMVEDDLVYISADEWNKSILLEKEQEVQ